MVLIAVRNSSLRAGVTIWLWRRLTVAAIACLLRWRRIVVSVGCDLWWRRTIGWLAIWLLGRVPVALLGRIPLVVLLLPVLRLRRV